MKTKYEFKRRKNESILKTKLFYLMLNSNELKSLRFVFILKVSLNFH